MVSVAVAAAPLRRGMEGSSYLLTMAEFPAATASAVPAGAFGTLRLTLSVFYVSSGPLLCLCIV